jgi:hypothetical protein
MKKSLRSLRRYQEGGSVSASDIDPNYLSKRINQGFDTARSMIGMSNMADKLMKGGSGSDTGKVLPGSDMSGGTGSPVAGGGSRKGGPIRKTYGPKLGKEDGVIAAQRGEYVVRKSAAKKLGKSALDTINRGKLPVRKGAR